MSPAIQLIAINKSFGAVHANKDVNLSVERGTIHGIVGENGAGKSTLMSILYGFYEADTGDILINGHPNRIRSPNDAIQAGIGMVHQHFMLVEPLSVVENVMLGAEGGAMLAKGEAKVRAELARLAKDYGLEIDVDATVGDLSVGLQQRVEILKALYRGADILILDEPTAVLTPAEADALFVLLRSLKEQGKTVILITHKLREIMAITDRVSVMRRGEMVATLETARTSPPELAELMVGRRVLLRVEKAEKTPGAPLLEVEGLSVVDARGVLRVANASFTVRAGEIVGIAGVAGNGQSELLEAIAGMRQPVLGQIRLEGKTIPPAEHDPHRMRRLGLLHVPEDRLRMGLVPSFPAFESAILGFSDEPWLGPGPLLDHDRLIADLAKKMEQYDVRPPAPRLKSSKFSGGNQQKIVLAREIERNPKVLLVGQPTRGVDIGAIEFIHRRLIALRDAGVAILLVSVELDEIMNLSDRILTMCGGKITGERKASETNEQELGLLMAGVTDEAA
ncbi:simple sugar transport system ATP-binding protein [Microvirga flocculans]|uniref:Simple sugar transport system ATP-binding protein n=1 Tax=Microvirga flocculans TaxID=217168 RepID=A0A7W6N8B3_9HYPH|nr:ABC transporter ATP-binding protein [Microvirga flocculans]MBB4040517.1 simple sugar transport system ATP-binding protein [Microvirga flocculans]